MRDNANPTGRDLAEILDRYRAANSASPPRRKDAVDQLVALARNLHVEVLRVHIDQVGRGPDNLGGRRIPAGVLNLYHVLGGGWGVHLLSPLDGPQDRNGLPDDLDIAICRSLLEVFIDLGSVMPGYDVHKRAHEALDAIAHHPVGRVALDALTGGYGVGALESLLGGRSVSDSPPVGIDDLLDAIFRRFDSFSDASYWSEFVRLSLSHFSLDSGRDGWIIPAAIGELSNSVVPFQGALEVPEVVGAAYSCTPDFVEVQSSLVDIQRRFMRALILEVDPSMSHRTTTLEQLQELGLPEERYIDPDNW